MASTPIAHALSSVTVGPAISLENLTMVPLLAIAAAPAPAPAPAPARKAPSAPSAPSARPAPRAYREYVTLDEALASGWAEITEVSEQGSVPELRFVNRGPQPTLILDGEELVGAKQNRIVNLTILVDAHSELIIPVSCVEAGRWRARSRAFAAAPRTQYASGRAKRMAQVSMSMRVKRSYQADQAEVWADIAAKSTRMHASSPTSAMEALFVDHRASIEPFVSACAPVDAQVGALFAVSGHVVGMDLFDRESTLRKVLPKLVRSVAVDAIDRGDGPGDGDGAVPLDHQVARFLAAVTAIPQMVSKAIALGDDVRLAGSGITGAALIVDERVIHLSAFNQVPGA